MSRPVQEKFTIYGQSEFATFLAACVASEVIEFALRAATVRVGHRFLREAKPASEPEPDEPRRRRSVVDAVVVASIGLGDVAAASAKAKASRWQTMAEAICGEEWGELTCHVLVLAVALVRVVVALTAGSFETDALLDTLARFGVGFSLACICDLISHVHERRLGLVFGPEHVAFPAWYWCRRSGWLQRPSSPSRPRRL